MHLLSGYDPISTIIKFFIKTYLMVLIIVWIINLNHTLRLIFSQIHSPLTNYWVVAFSHFKETALNHTVWKISVVCQIFFVNPWNELSSKRFYPYHYHEQMCATCQNRLIWWAGSSNILFHLFTMIKSNNRIDSICLVLTFMTIGFYYQIKHEQKVEIFIKRPIWFKVFDYFYVSREDVTSSNRN